MQRFGVGVNSIDLDAASELGKIILNIPGFCAKELADLAAAMILGLVRNTAYYDREIRKGGWPKCTYLLPPDVRTLTLGLYGFGAAGQNLYKIMHGGFGIKTIACDPYLPDSVKAQYPDVEFVDFDALVERSDVVSIHVGLTEETHHIFNADTFKRMKNTAMIINTARGPVVDEKALASALANHTIAAAGLDVYENEPDVDPALKTLANVVMMPHVGSATLGTRTNMGLMVARNVEAVLNGSTPPNEVKL